MNLNVWDCLQRWRHRKGFGVHSPWAYELVRDVLFSRHLYYVFDELKGSSDDEQLFRLVSWLKAERMMVEGVSESGRKHLLAACPTLEIIPWDGDKVDASVCLVVEDIRGAGSRVWDEAVVHAHATSSFDLGRRGIVFFDPARQRMTYRL